jgi:hypothetical protein
LPYLITLNEDQKGNDIYHFSLGLFKNSFTWKKQYFDKYFLFNCLMTFEESLYQINALFLSDILQNNCIKYCNSFTNISVTCWHAITRQISLDFMPESTSLLFHQKQSSFPYELFKKELRTNCYRLNAIKQISRDKHVSHKKLEIRCLYD